MPKYEEIYKFYESCFDKHGDTPEGLAWQNLESMNTRFNVMAELFTTHNQVDQPKILDLGCGTGHFLIYLLLPKVMPSLKYTGMDISNKFIEFCKKTYVEVDSCEGFYVRDIIKNPLEADIYDYAVMNGILTVKNKLSFDEMWDFAQQLIKAAYAGASQGIAFNFMSKQVDWERDDLFHVPLDTVAEFLTKEISRHFVIRNDYGLYEYTVYVYKNSI